MRPLPNTYLYLRTSLRLYRIRGIGGFGLSSNQSLLREAEDSIFRAHNTFQSKTQLVTTSSERFPHSIIDNVEA